MYQSLIILHSILRWFVLLSLGYSLYKAYKGYYMKSNFTKTDNYIRHWTATIAHIQLVVGIILYSQSPVINYFWSNFNLAIQDTDATFFGLIHIFLMFASIIIVTIGSALSKRKSNDQEKFKTIILWFSIALFLIFIAIPWPFSPLANRPYLR